MRATRPRTVTITTIVVVGVSTGIGSPARAEFANGGFEDGLSGWTTMGAVGTGGAYLGTGPIAGDSSAIITNINDHIEIQFGRIDYVEAAVGVATVESFLGVPAESIQLLNGLGGYEGIEEGAGPGSAIKKSFAVTAGDTISFDFNFITEEGTSPFGVENHRFDDFAFVSMTLDGVLSELSVLAKASDPGFGPRDLEGILYEQHSAETGILTFSHTFASGGLVELGIGVMDHGETGWNSVVLVDNVAITPVPTPSSLVLFGMGGLTLLGYRTRNLRKTELSV